METIPFFSITSFGKNTTSKQMLHVQVYTVDRKLE